MKRKPIDPEGKCNKWVQTTLKPRDALRLREYADAEHPSVFVAMRHILLIGLKAWDGEEGEKY